MAEYSFDAGTIRSFGSLPCPADAAGGLSYWADLADSAGPAMLPFLVRADKWDKVPFAELGLKKLKPSELAPQPKEMWILFCFRRDGWAEPAATDSPLRQDGFPLVLEWRKGGDDSMLLSPAFRDLAQKVREQIGTMDWSLHPAFGRYGDKISFADPGLFSDAEHASSIASAWGALIAGLFCAVRNRWPRIWPFPTIQWTPETGCTAGVAGLREKLSVASDFGAEVVAVDRNQLRQARAELRTLRKEGRASRNNGPALFGVSSGTPAATAERIARSSQWKTRRRRRLLAALHVLPVLGATALAAVGYIRWEARRVSAQAFGEVLSSLSVHAGAYDAAVEAQSRLMDAAKQSVETGKARFFSDEIPVFRRAMDNALATMETARLDEEAFRNVRKSKFDSGELKTFFDTTDAEVKQAQLDLPVLLGPAVSARYPGAREETLSLLERQRRTLDFNAGFYALGVMDILSPSDAGESGEFRNFAKGLRFLPRFSGTWLFDKTSIEEEAVNLLESFERSVVADESELAVSRSELSRRQDEFVADLVSSGISEERAESILDSVSKFSAMKTELNYATNKLDMDKRDRYRKHRALSTDDDGLLWGKMLAFKSWKMPEAAWEAAEILERRGSDTYRPGAIRAAKAIVLAGDTLPFTNGIMVLSFMPPATSHALFQPGDIIVGFDDRRVDWFPDYKSVPGGTYRFWRLGEDGTFSLQEGVLSPGQPLTAFENVNPNPSEH